MVDSKNGGKSAPGTAGSATGALVGSVSLGGAAAVERRESLIPDAKSERAHNTAEVAARPLPRRDVGRAVLEARDVDRVLGPGWRGRERRVRRRRGHVVRARQVLSLAAEESDFLSPVVASGPERDGRGARRNRVSASERAPVVLWILPERARPSVTRAAADLHGPGSGAGLNGLGERNEDDLPAGASCARARATDAVRRTGISDGRVADRKKRHPGR